MAGEKPEGQEQRNARRQQRTARPDIGTEMLGKLPKLLAGFQSHSLSPTGT
jgi:hypothetical protein